MKIVSIQLFQTSRGLIFVLLYGLHLCPHGNYGQPLQVMRMWMN